MNTITFIEQYCLSNGKHIKLKDYQKKFIKLCIKMKWMPMSKVGKME